MPDGRPFVVSDGTILRMMDRSGAAVWAINLDPRRYLAGVGAATRDGTAVAVVELGGCLDDCDRTELATRTWTISYLDAATGKPHDAPAFATVTGMAVRVLGSTDDGELVLLRHMPGADTRKQRYNPDFDDTGWWGDRSRHAARPVARRLRPDPARPALRRTDPRRTREPHPPGPIRRRTVTVVDVPGPSDHLGRDRAALGGHDDRTRADNTAGPGVAPTNNAS